MPKKKVKASTKAKKPGEFRSFIITAFQKRGLHVNRYSILHKIGNKSQAVQGDFIRMDKMGGDLKPFSGLLQFQVFHLEIVEPERIVVVKKVRVIGNGPCSKTQGLNMRNFFQSIDGTHHIFLV